VGFLSSLKGGEYVDLQNTSAQMVEEGSSHEDESETGFPLDRSVDSDASIQNTPQLHSARPKSVFLAHGKNRKPLEQLKEMLREVGVPYEVAVDEAHAGRPVSQKVANMMRELCSSAIVIFSADEQFFREGPNGERTEVWRPSENAVYELGAASVLYGRRIIIFKEDRVTLPSDFSDLGHISFHGDQIQAHWTELLRELKAHGIVEIRVAA
jgi:predicted nucleotide-binding protein